MVICIFGESCTGKSTLAQAVSARTGAKIYTGRDYMRLAKSEAAARVAFSELLAQSVSSSEDVIYVTTEPGDMALLPEGSIRVLVTAQLETIQQRFAARMGGRLPAPVAAMLERKHGAFDKIPCDFHAENGEKDSPALLELIDSMRR